MDGVAVNEMEDTTELKKLTCCLWSTNSHLQNATEIERNFLDFETSAFS